MKFHAIGMMGMVVQLTSLRVLIAIGVHYMATTGIAVEIALIHNYFWHLRWTWPDRTRSARLQALVRFQVASGGVSIVSNVLLMRLLAGHMHLPLVQANLLAIGAMSGVNYLIGDRWVFRSALPASGAA